MADIPTTIDIGPHRYLVECTDDTSRRLQDDFSTGDSTPDRLNIRLDGDRPHTVVAETLLHEVMHCAWHVAGLRSHPDLGDDLQEQVICALAPQLLDALRRNPQLVAHLTATTT